MPKRIILIGYKLGSASLKELALAFKAKLNLPALKVRKDSTKYQPRYTDYIINWGCSQQWPFITHDKKDGHQYAINKLDFFKKISNYNETTANQVNIPDWTDNAEIAKQWKSLVVCRKLLSSHSGNGIVLHENGGDTELPKAPLYVAYKKKRHEYRVHFFKKADGTLSVIDVTQKKKRKGAEQLDTKIRNHQNGWVYAREDIQEPHDLREQALRTATALDLKFGAVDLIWNEKENKSYVLEVNTAPGITGTTLENYVTAFIGDM